MFGPLEYLKRLPIAILVPVLLSDLLFAQSGDVSLRGQVTDPSGASVPAITVTIIGPGETVLAVQTDEQGRYVFYNLSPGTYMVQIRAKGFANFEKAGIVIARGLPQVVDVHLEVFLEKQQVTVTDGTMGVSANPSANVSSLILKGKDLEALSDDPDELESELKQLAGPSAGPNGGQIYIDGFTGGQLPPKAAIREVRVNQNPFSAQYDKLGYGRIEILTKPGLDKLHGQIFAMGNTSALNSRNPFATEVPAYHSLYLNGNVGGPLSRKASFFFDGGRRSIQDTPIVSAVVLDSALNSVPFSQSVFAPAARTELSPRLDYQVNTSNILTVRYQYWKNTVTNGGVGQLTLPSQAYDGSGSEQTFQVSDSQVLGDRVVNETRFRYLRATSNQTPTSLQPTIDVLGAFQGGGNSGGQSRDTQDRYELQNYTFMNRGKHFLRFGARLRDVRESNSSTGNFNGTFTFPSLDAYRITEQGLQQGLTPAQIQAAGGGASQFLVASGNPLAHVSLADLGLYGEDDWRPRPNMTISLGLRFETQSDIHDHADWAPRIGLAWGIGGHGRNPKTVLRAGAGVFYDRFSETQVLLAERLNGLNQQQYVVTSPEFYPTVPTPSVLAGSQTVPTTYRIDPNLQAPYLTQAGVGIERQVTKNANVSVTYLNSHGVHQLLSRNVNAPLPGTYNPSDPSSGVRPLEQARNVYQYESDGLFNQNQVIANFNLRAGTKLSLFGFYTLNYAESNTAGVGSFPVDQYNLATNYGRASFDVRHRVFMGGTLGLPLRLQMSPFLVASSGAPFNITLGQDLNGDSIFNDRPAFATGSSGSHVVVTRYGTFNAYPTSADRIIPPNIATGPGQFSLNMRLAKTFGFGKKRGGGTSGGNVSPHSGGPGTGVLLNGGGRSASGMSDSSSSKRYNLEFSIWAQNVFNNVNLASPIGTLDSPLFGRSNAIAVGPHGGGQGANRSLMLLTRFSF